MTQTSNGKVSVDSSLHVNVITCVYNGAQYIGDAINSVHKQTYSNLSFTIVDDGSVDDTLQVVQSALEKKARNNVAEDNVVYYDIPNLPVHVIQLPENRGPSYARNRAIELLWPSADTFQILDSDDIMEPNKIERLVPRIREDPQVGVVYADYYIFNMNNGLSHYELKEPFSRRRILEECIVHSGALISKPALEYVYQETGQFYDERVRLAEDLLLWNIISERFMCIHVAEPLTKVRVHGKDSTHSNSQRHWQQSWQYVANKIRERNA